MGQRIVKIDQSPTFIRATKQLIKKYKSIYGDIDNLKPALLNNLKQGQALGKDCYKIRMAITSKGQGKSGGARVITCVKVLADRIILLTIYDKSEKENLAPGELDALLHEVGLE